MPQFYKELRQLAKSKQERMNRLKTYITIASLIVALLSGLYGFYSSVRADIQKRRADNLQDELTVKTTEVMTYQNAAGQTVTRTIEYEKTIKQLKNSKDTIEQELYKAYKASNLKDKQIKALTKIIVDGQGGGSYADIDTLWITDTIYKGTIKKYRDNFIEIYCYEDSLDYKTHLELDVLEAGRLVPRKFQPFRWLNHKWELQKLTDKGLVEITTNIPNSKVFVRKIKAKHN